MNKTYYGYLLEVHTSWKDAKGFGWTHTDHSLHVTEKEAFKAYDEVVLKAGMVKKLHHSRAQMFTRGCKGGIYSQGPVDEVRHDFHQQQYTDRKPENA